MGNRCKIRRPLDLYVCGAYRFQCRQMTNNKDAEKLVACIFLFILKNGVIVERISLASCQVYKA